MRTAESHRKDYEAKKASIIGDIWFHIYNQPDHALDMMETKGINAIVIWSDGDGISETLDELFATGDIADNSHKVIAIGNCPQYGIEEESYDITEFEIPPLLDILESIEKHIQRLEE